MIHILWGGGGSSRHFPGSIFCGVAEFFPLTPVTTGPKFVLFKHVLSFARIMSTLCPNSCRQTARIGGGQLPPPAPRPVRLCKLCWLFSASVRLYTFGDRLNVVDRCENSHWDKGLKGIDCHSFMYMNRQ